MPRHTALPLIALALASVALTGCSNSTAPESDAATTAAVEPSASAATETPAAEAKPFAFSSNVDPAIVLTGPDAPQTGFPDGVAVFAADQIGPAAVGEADNGQKTYEAFFSGDAAAAVASLQAAYAELGYTATAPAAEGASPTSYSDEYIVTYFTDNLPSGAGYSVMIWAR
ncbi:hypothetical protein [Microbacterium radiodurans]|uniref:Uncharacterized protein n=1 Tax=Microbacterium radiodurans TaxID=661398 RepID=A0A5J5IQT6_9MICO|nr:hypothetical protein [Microbacterium radiodurans]KAA9083741.1 hypothetical protein F6B42_14410 [Microbacterium radiodurans]